MELHVLNKVLGLGLQCLRMLYISYKIDGTCIEHSIIISIS